MNLRGTVTVTKAGYWKSLKAAARGGYRKGLRTGAARKQAEVDQFVARFRFLKGLNGDTDGFIRAWVETNRKGFDPAEKRGADGEWTEGSASAGGATTTGVTPTEHRQDTGTPADPADERAESLLSRLAAVPRRVRERVGAFVEGKYAQLSERYGDAGAKAVLGATVLLLPVPVPGTSFIPVALAEVVLRLRRAVQGTPGPGGETEAKALVPELTDDGKIAERARLSPGEVGAAARELLADLYAECGWEFGEDCPGEQDRGASAAPEPGAAGGETVEKGFDESKVGRETTAHGGKKPGEFAPKGSGGDPDGSASPKADADEHRPSHPARRHKNKTLPVKPWRDPPPPQGKARGTGVARRPKGKRSQTLLGDRAEELAAAFGLRSILPPGRRSNVNVEREGSSIDREFDHSGVAYEVKMCRVEATEYKAKPKRSEIDDKLRYARRHKLTPKTMIAVWDAKRREVHYYASKAVGIVTNKLSPEHFDYVGTVSF